MGLSTTKETCPEEGKVRSTLTSGQAPAEGPGRAGNCFRSQPSTGIRRGLTLSAFGTRTVRMRSRGPAASVAESQFQ